MAWLFDSVGMTPHGFCLLWDPGLIWTYAISDLGIALAYFSIPLALWVIAHRRRDLTFRSTYLLFAAFILLCGTTHVLDVVTLFVPAYGAEAVVKAGTASVSILAAIFLWRVLPQALAMPSSAQLEAANTALRESEARYRANFANSPVPMHVLDGNFVITDVSNSWMTLLGYSREEVIGRPVSDVWVSDKDSYKADLVRLLENGRIDDLERRYVCQNGTVLDLLVAARVERRGTVTSIVASLTDITARKAAEKALRSSEERLHQAQKMEAIGQLTGGIAHDFNNMLQGIMGGLDMMERAIALGRHEGVARYIATARNSVERAAGLTQRMLAFARRQALQPRSVDADKLVGGMEELLRRTMAPEISVEISLRDGAWSVLCDPNQLESAILNLAINARDAMPSGGTLGIQTSDRSVAQDELADHEEAHPGQYVEIAVSDNGIGMTPDVTSRVFEPFFTTKPTGQGTGLGLSQVFGFVRQSGGFVRLESEPDAGTVVRLYLPRYQTGDASVDRPLGVTVSSATSEIVASSPSSKTVLVVEDESELRVMIAELLRDLGCLVLEAEDGDSTLKLVQSRAQIDLLVTDIGLPGMNGRQLADASRSIRPHLPVLLITGYAGRALSDTKLPFGMEIIRKPFAFDELATRVRTLLRERVSAV